MKLVWTNKALSDLVRLHKFLAPANKQAAAKIIQALIGSPDKLLEQPRIGERIAKFNTREVRRIFIRSYEIRYEIDDNIIYILQIWHTRENRH